MTIFLEVLYTQSRDRISMLFVKVDFRLRSVEDGVIRGGVVPDSVRHELHEGGLARFENGLSGKSSGSENGECVVSVDTNGVHSE